MTRPSLDARADFRLRVRHALVSEYGVRLTMRRNARRELDKLLTRASRAGLFDDVTRSPVDVAREVWAQFVERGKGNAR